MLLQDKKLEIKRGVLMEEKREYCVYKHTSKIDGRAYVGITRVGTKQRWHNGKGYKRNRYFWRYIQKYGWDSLYHEILYNNLTEEEAVRIEKELIAKWDLTNRDKGFNLDMGGSTNNVFWRGVYCIETGKEYAGARIAERDTGISAGRICTCCNGKYKSAGKDENGNPLHWVYADEKEIIPQRLKEIEECKTKYSITLYDVHKNVIAHYNSAQEAAKETGRITSNIQKDCNHPHKFQDGIIWIYDKDYSDEELQRRINLVLTEPPQAKGVYQYDLHGNFIKYYSSVMNASRETGCNNTEIAQRCNGIGYTCGGYLWSYEPKTFSEEWLLEAQNKCNCQTILQYNFNMELIGEYPQGEGLIDNPKYNYKHIRAVCNRFHDCAYGYVWRFKGEFEEQFNKDKEFYSNRKTTFVREQKIVQYNLDGQVVNIYDSLTQADNDGWNRNRISLCCRGKRDTYKVYIWKYAE